MGQQDTLQRQVSAAILQLRLHSPFFATLALFARIIISQETPTAATNGRDVFINEDYWNSLTRPERLGLISHEVLHAALLHVMRRGTRERILWNVAADIVVNGIVLADQKFQLPKGGIRDKKLEMLSVEEIYHILQKEGNWRTPEILDLLDEGEGGEDGTAKKTYAEIEQHWRQALQQAQILARMAGQGNLPAGLQRELPNINPAQLDWRSYLWRFLVRTPTDFQEFDRRFIGMGLYLDTLAGESVRVYVAVDTSGSIGTEEISQFLSEVTGILNAYPHLEAELYYADADCYGPYALSSGAEIPEPVGGGGTDFRPFFQAVAARQTEGHTTEVCVYLTDGYGAFPEDEPEFAVLWVISPGGIDVNSVPFGEAVRLIPD